MVRVLLCAVLMTGCADSEQFPPPPTLSLVAPATLPIGSTVSLEVNGAWSGERVYVLASLRGTGVGPCDPLLGGACLGLRPPVRLLASPLADSTGTAIVRPTIPAFGIGQPIAFQAVVVRGYSGSDSEFSLAQTGVVGVPSACPPEMAELPSGVCIDRWEAHLAGQSPYAVPTSGTAVSAPGVPPQGYISGDVAGAACAAAGKRLCELGEWQEACAGSGRTYPYGDVYDPDACNTERAQHPVIELFGAGATWSPTQMNDPRLNQLPDSLAVTGGHPQCVTPEGVYDLHGNVHEWVADPAGTFKGGFYVDAVINGAGCGYTTTAHTTSYHDYSTGFRCCLSP